MRVGATSLCVTEEGSPTHRLREISDTFVMLRSSTPISSTTADSDALKASLSLKPNSDADSPDRAMFVLKNTSSTVAEVGSGVGALVGSGVG